MIRAQPCPRDFACFLVNGVRHDRKCVHIQPDARTLNNHRRPPDLQMWLYQRECSPTPATHESFCSTRPSASASPHTNLFNDGQVIGVCSHDVLGAGSGSLALIPAAQLGLAPRRLASRVGAAGWEWLKRGLQSRKLVCPPATHVH